MSVDLVVVLSSFNGGKFVEEQIESLRRQTLTDWTLLVRDDGSSDDTVARVARLTRVDPRIMLLRDGLGKLGPAACFGTLVERAGELGARFVALADQDDVWQPAKLARQLEVLREREAAVGATTPLLVHSDLRVVAEDLSVIHPSFLTFHRLRHVPEWPLGALLMQNFVTGCTAMINGALLRAAAPLPRVVMHDWWLALCAAALGEILYLPEATVLYRQHDANTVGSRGWLQVALETIRRPYKWWKESGDRFDVAVDQACELARRVEGLGSGSSASTPALNALREFSDAFGNGRPALRRLQAVRRNSIRPQSLLPYPVFFYLRVLLRSGSAADRPAIWSRVGGSGPDRRKAPRPAIFNPKDGPA
jgi:rhamnosyltransferase